ncbi:hypothetical protein [Streptomyces microflavus]|uniref:hypothetical protein n=1 Tax=Streptomyces microflavus TaxID=1919 RepID=UPI002E3035D7|nr:hypothetical protein [Streptomyces microflavus]
MTTELTVAQQELADTKAEIAELQGLIDGLEEQVREGEAAEEAQQLGEKYGVLRVAQLRQEAAERKLAKAEAAELARRRAAAEAAARADMVELSDAALAVKYAAALAALDDLAAVCVRREDAMREHLAVFADLGMKNVIANAPPQHIFALDGEKFEVGTRRPQDLVTRATAHVFRVRALRDAPRIGGSAHPVERVLTAWAGMSERETKAADVSGSLAGRLVEAARKGMTEEGF